MMALGHCALLNEREALREKLAALRILAPRYSARYFGLPIYLVGSALERDEPGDFDVLVIVPDALFCAMFGMDAGELGDAWNPSVPAWRRWARDSAKQSKELTLAVRYAVDFRTQMQSTAELDEYKDRPKEVLFGGLNL